MRHLFERPLRCRGADPLQPPSGDGFEPLQAERKVRSPLGGNERMNLIDDDCFYAAQRSGGFRGQEQIQRLGSSDENFRGMTPEACPVALGSVGGADADFGIVEDYALL